MARIDNDETKGLAVPFLILAHVRTGGTFMAHALSNHPEVFCDRGETLHHLSAWRKVGVRPKRLMLAIWGMDGYHAAGFRAIYRQAFHPIIWPLIIEMKPRIIHLTRENVTRQGVSFGYQQLVRQGKLPYHPVHTFKRKKPKRVQADPMEILGYAVKVREEMETGAAQLADYPGKILAVTYEAMISDRPISWMAPDIGDQVADFLGVRHKILDVALQRDFPMPMAKWFKNWDEIRAALEGAGFGGLDG